MAEYKKLDLTALKFSDHVCDINEALENITSMAITKDMFDENGVLRVKSVQKDKENKCIKLLIS